jgi:hypothetical protein
MMEKNEGVGIFRRRVGVSESRVSWENKKW